MVESFEDQAMRYTDDRFWQAKDSVNIAQQAFHLESTILPSLLPLRNPLPPNVSRGQFFENNMTSRGLETVPASPGLARGPKLRKIIYKPGESAKASSLYRQKKLALDIIKLLETKDQSDNIQAAALRFFDAFEEGLPNDDSGLVKELTDAVAQLSKACQLENEFEISEKIFDIVAGYRPIDEDVFHSLHPEGLIKNVLRGFNQDSVARKEVEVSKLRKAAALYLTKFTKKPKIASQSWTYLGEILCAATNRYELFDLTEAVYWRMDQARGDRPNRCVHHLIAALHTQGRHKELIKIFRRIFVNASPDQLKFYTIGNIVIESTLELQRLDLAEEVLLSLAKMSGGGKIRCSTTWFLKVLGSEWRTHRELSRTRALFDRMKPHFYLIAHPQALYGAMVQFSVEAGDEIAASMYYEYTLENAPPGPPTQQALRVRGHFAYAKAIRNDWTGVQEDFRQMRELSPGQYEFSASFTPILKLFAKSHSVNETEEFLRTFVDNQYVLLTPYMSTTMINKYAESREIDSIVHWIDYMTSVQSPADPVFFNAILYNCLTKWKFSFEETYRLYQKVRKIPGPAAKFLNGATVSILRRAAIAGAEGNIADAIGYLNRLKLDQPLRLAEDSETVQEHMAIALAKGNPRRALRIYARAQNNVVPLDAACISTAVKASLQLDPNNISAAVNLLRKPRRDGLDIRAAIEAIFIHQMSYKRIDMRGRHIRVQDKARSTIYALEDLSIKAPPAMVTHTMHILVRQGQYYQAIDFWKSMIGSQKMKSSPDLPTLTVLLKAYIGARDRSGIEWAIQTLAINNFVPDKLFTRPLKLALKEMRVALEDKELRPFDREFYEVLENAFQRVSALRLEATQDKEKVKRRTIEIMEKAIEIDKSSIAAKAYEDSKVSIKGQFTGEVQSSTSILERSPELFSWRPIEEAEHNVPQVGRLVGVHAG